MVLCSCFYCHYDCLCTADAAAEYRCRIKFFLVHLQAAANEPRLIYAVDPMCDHARMRARAVLTRAVLLLCYSQGVATGGYATMRAVVTLENNTAFAAGQSQREFNAVSSCLYPSWTLVQSALSNHSHRDGDECRCYDDRFNGTSKTCMACFAEVSGRCSDPSAVTSGACSSDPPESTPPPASPGPPESTPPPAPPAPVRLEFVASVVGTVLEFLANQQAYEVAVANSLQVEPAAVRVKRFYLAGSQRRLLQATPEVMVETEVVVAREAVPDLTGAALAATLDGEMRAAGIEIGAISNVGVAAIEVVTTTTTTPAELSAPVRLEFVASVVGSVMEFMASRQAYEAAVANSLQVERAAVKTPRFYLAGSQRRLLAASSEVMVETEVLVPPERVPDVSGAALVAALQGEMQAAGIEISAISNAVVTVLGAVATTTTTSTTTPAAEEDGVPLMLIIVVAASAGGVVLLCVVCGCVVCLCTQGSADDGATQRQSRRGAVRGPPMAAACIHSHDDGRGVRTILRQISASDICV